MFGRYDEVFDAPPSDIGDRLAHYLDAAATDRDWGRLVTWEALEFGEGAVVNEAARRDQFAAEVARLRADQAAARLPADLDPEQLLLTIQSLTVFTCEHLRALGRLLHGNRTE